MDEVAVKGVIVGGVTVGGAVELGAVVDGGAGMMVVAGRVQKLL